MAFGVGIQDSLQRGLRQIWHKCSMIYPATVGIQDSLQRGLRPNKIG